MLLLRDNETPDIGDSNLYNKIKIFYTIFCDNT